MTLGPLMVDVAGLELTDDDRERLMHPLVGGVILFSRNFRDPAQLAALTAEIQAIETAASTAQQEATQLGADVVLPEDVTEGVAELPDCQGGVLGG